MTLARLFGILLLVIASLGIGSDYYAQESLISPGVIVFEREGGIYLINSDGSDERFIAEGQDPEISPTGTRIAYVRGFEVFVNNLEGTNEQQFSFLPADFAFAPSWSPDEQSLVIWEPSAANAISGERIQFQNIHRVDLNFFFVEPITQDTAFQQDPDWSPDGSKILLTSSEFRESTFNIFTMNPDGSEITQLTDNDFSLFDAVWSPDGTQIAYSNGSDLFLMEADGTNPRSITATLIERELSPTWSPDGKEIAYEIVTAFNIVEIHAINLETGEDRVIARSDSHIFNPHWGIAAE